MDDAKIPAPFRIERLCYLPFHLAKTELVVRPCVAFLHAADPPVPTGPVATVEDSLIPRLDAKEVAAVFSAPFHNFLRAEDEPAALLPAPAPAPLALPPGKWYEGSWTHWHEERWRMHYFYVPVANQRVTRPRVRDGGLASLSEHAEDDVAEEETGRYKVWGMTARILVDAAMVAYGEQPEFEHDSHFGDEAMIEGLATIGRLDDKKRPGSQFQGDELRRVKKMTKM